MQNANVRNSHLDILPMSGAEGGGRGAVGLRGGPRGRAFTSYYVLAGRRKLGGVMEEASWMRDMEEASWRRARRHVFLLDTQTFLLVEQGDTSSCSDISLSETDISLSLRQTYLSLRKTYLSLGHRRQTYLSLGKRYLSGSQRCLSGREMCLSQGEMSFSERDMSEQEDVSSW